MMETKFTIPAGNYYLGDPCYCFENGWSSALEDSDRFKKPLIQNGFTAISFRTKYGDGIYLDQYGMRYFVDAGMIGLVPVQMIEAKNDVMIFNSRCNGQFVQFDEPTECKQVDGKLFFGDIVIDTDPPDDEEDEED